MSGQAVAKAGVVAGDYVEDPGRKANLLTDLRNKEIGERRQPRRFDNKRAAGSQRRANLVAQIEQREVPGEIGCNGTNRLIGDAVLGVTLFSSFVLIFGNLVVDVLYAVVDPRIRLA